MGDPGKAEMETNEWAVKHPLERVELVLNLDRRGWTTMEATGRCSGKRAPLWVFRYEVHTLDNRYTAVDLASHVLLVSEQDRPRKLEQLEQGMCGGQGWQPALY